MGTDEANIVTLEVHTDFLYRRLASTATNGGRFADIDLSPLGAASVATSQEKNLMRVSVQCDTATA